MEKFSTTCKICSTKTSSLKELHKHIKKEHGMYLTNYYPTYFPRTNLLTGKPIQFKDVFEYIQKDFESEKEMVEWLNISESKDIKEWIIKRLIFQKEIKNREMGLSCVDLQTAPLMPPMSIYVKYFGSYAKACEEVNITPLFLESKDIPKISKKKITIAIDTREQNPLNFSRSIEQKLSFGDYTAFGENYSYTYIDRKNSSDFKGTMVKGFERFRREMEKCVACDSFMYVVVEDSVENMILENKYSKFSSNLPFAFKRMRDLHQEFRKNIQFIFTGNRRNSERLIPYLLIYGKYIWDLDIQYFLQKRGFFKC